MCSSDLSLSKPLFSLSHLPQSLSPPYFSLTPSLSDSKSLLSLPLFCLCLPLSYSLILCLGLLVPEKPLPQGGPGSMAGFLGCTVAVVFILGVALTVFFLYHRQQKSRLEVDGGG